MIGAVVFLITFTLFRPEETIKLGDSGKKYKDLNYIVNVENLKEEQGLVNLYLCICILFFFHYNK